MKGATKLTKEIEIIGKAIGPDLMGKKVTTAEFVNVIELYIDSFQKQINDASHIINECSIDDEPVDDELILEKTISIVHERSERYYKGIKTYCSYSNYIFIGK